MCPHFEIAWFQVLHMDPTLRREGRAFLHETSHRHHEGPWMALNWLEVPDYGPVERDKPLWSS